MSFKEWAASYFGRSVHVGDLVDLAIVETDDAHSMLTSLYAWKYEHIATSAKALAGAGSAIAIATLVPLTQIDPDAAIEWGWMATSWISAAILILGGILTFSFARRVHAEFVSAQALLAELIEIRAFLKRIRSQEGAS
jgi:Na+/melibiose symporter-like transporter